MAAEGSSSCRECPHGWREAHQTPGSVLCSTGRRGGGFALWQIFAKHEAMPCQGCHCPRMLSESWADAAACKSSCPSPAGTALGGTAAGALVLSNPGPWPGASWLQHVAPRLLGLPEMLLLLLPGLIPMPALCPHATHWGQAGHDSLRARKKLPNVFPHWHWFPGDLHLGERTSRNVVFAPFQGEGLP